MSMTFNASSVRSGNTFDLASLQRRHELAMSSASATVTQE